MATITTTPFAVTSPTTLGVTSGDTIYYYIDNTVGPTHQTGSVIAGGSTLFRTPMWIVSASSSVVTFTPGPPTGATISTPATGRTTLGTLVASVQAFDGNGNSLGFVPVYNTIT